MKRNALYAALICTLGLTLTAVHADDTATTGTKPVNAATPAVTNGPGVAATPALPGNPTAQEKVKANRLKAQQQRDAAAMHRDGAKGDHAMPEVQHPSVSRPEVTRPEITKPEITRPEMTRPEVTRPEITRPEMHR
jgi:hypothetical protein